MTEDRGPHLRLAQGPQELNPALPTVQDVEGLCERCELDAQACAWRRSSGDSERTTSQTKPTVSVIAINSRTTHWPTHCRLYYIYSTTRMTSVST